MPEGDAHWVLFEDLKPDQLARLRRVLEEKRRRAAESALAAEAEGDDLLPAPAA